MSNQTAQSTTGTQGETEKQICRVKWFNGKSGYGFATTVDSPERDVFVHHSAVKVAAEQYKYLVPGEYVDLVVEASEEEGKWQAVEVTGVRGGPLQCETKLALREEFEQRDGGDERDGGRHAGGRGRRSRSNGDGEWEVHRSTGRRPRGRTGGGPRDDGEWVLTRRR